MRIGLIGRFKPPHLGTDKFLKYMCKESQFVHIGIGSSNQYNARNPFTVAETTDMINITLRGFDNYKISEIPDFGDGEKWAKHVYSVFGNLTYFVSGNEYVIDLLKDRYYRIIHPVTLPNVTSEIRSTEVRIGMAFGFGHWKHLVTDEIAKYIEDNRLDQRLRNEFGAELMEIVARADWKSQSIQDELNNVRNNFKK